MEGSGFYKAYDGELFYGQIWVRNKNYTLNRETYEGSPDATEITDGWCWFNSEEAARTFFDIWPEEPEE